MQQVVLFFLASVFFSGSANAMSGPRPTRAAIGYQIISELPQNHGQEILTTIAEQTENTNDRFGVVELQGNPSSSSKNRSHPILFVGGPFQNAQSFQKILRAFAVKGFSVYFYQGRSTQKFSDLKSANAAAKFWNFDLVADDLGFLSDFIFQKEHEKPILAGFSSGGLVAMVAGSRSPRKYKGYLFLDSAFVVNDRNTLAMAEENCKQLSLMSREEFFFDDTTSAQFKKMSSSSPAQLIRFLSKEQNPPNAYVKKFRWFNANAQAELKHVTRKEALAFIDSFNEQEAVVFTRDYTCAIARAKFSDTDGENEFSFQDKLFSRVKGLRSDVLFFASEFGFSKIMPLTIKRFLNAKAHFEIVRDHGHFDLLLSEKSIDQISSRAAKRWMR